MAVPGLYPRRSRRHGGEWGLRMDGMVDSCCAVHRTGALGDLRETGIRVEGKCESVVC